MNRFEEKYINSNIYDQYLEILGNFPIEDDINNIEDDNCGLQLLLDDFYEFEDTRLDMYYSMNSEERQMYEEDIKIQEIELNIYKNNEQNCKLGLNNNNIVLFDSFPYHIVKKIIRFFIEKRLYSDIYTEVKKYLYKHWNNENISDVVQEIKNILIEVANFTPEEYLSIMLNSNNPRYNSRKHYRYYVFWLYCFYPLIDNYEELILKLINLVHLDDAQDYLMEGILLIESNKLLPFYIKFLINVWKSKNCYTGENCFDLWSSGTGALEQNIDIMIKLKKELNWNPFEEQELIEFWLDNSSYIDYLKKQIG